MLQSARRCEEFFAIDVGVARDSREVGVAEVLSDEASVADFLRSQVAAVWRSVCAVTCFSIPARFAARRMMSARIVSCRRPPARPQKSPERLKATHRVRLTS